MNKHPAKPLGCANEVVGRLTRLSDDGLTVLCEREYTIQVDPNELARWKPRLHVGRKLGILSLCDGKIRTRTLTQRDGRTSKTV